MHWNKYYDKNFTFSDERLINEFRDGNRDMDLFLKILALNHTVMPEFEEIDLLAEDNASRSSRGKMDGSTMKYQAQSPDEAALVTAARCFGYVFTGRTSDSITVNRLGHERTYDLLHIADFDNVRNGSASFEDEGKCQNMYAKKRMPKYNANLSLLCHCDL